MATPRLPRHACLLAIALAVVASTTALPAAAQSPTGAAHSHRPVCAPAAHLRARCHAEILTDVDEVTPLATTVPAAGALVPTDLRSAYQLPAGTAGSGMTIAIVNAFDNPNAASDLSAYRSRFGLPPCTTTSGCFAKVNQAGAAGPLPAPKVDWGQEIDLDLDMASAACPNCNLRLVEAASASLSDLGAAVDTAADVLHADAISNSYGAPEFGNETSSSNEGHYDHPGSAITASTGDGGYGVQFPAAARWVTAVGGTSLRRDASTRGWAETAWSGAGSGCSAYVPKPPWQVDTGCARRTVADVSAVADPNTGVAVYDTYGSSGGANWYVIGGTSAAAPIVAGVYALGGKTSTVTDASGAYGHTGSLFDVTSGTNASSCNPPYLCGARVGYDGPTGLGTPLGTGAFVGAASTSAPTQVVVNGDFETGALSPWVGGGAPAPVLSSGRSHGGTWSAQLGTPAIGATEPKGNSHLAESVAIPSSASAATLSFWYWGWTNDTVGNDWQELRIRSSSGAVLTRVFKAASNAQAWSHVNFDLSAYRGQTVQLWFNVHENGNGRPTGMDVDDVTLAVS